MSPLEQACCDIIHKNLSYAGEKIYLLYDTESPLAKRLSDAYRTVLSSLNQESIPSESPQKRWNSHENQELKEGVRNSTTIKEMKMWMWISHFGEITTREFLNPPQPLYRGWLINPDNPHLLEQNRLITTHNIAENIRVGLDHHETIPMESAEKLDPQIESILSELLSLPRGSIVILIQSTNFRLSTFRIRLELFNIGVHVIEFNHLAYIRESEFDAFEKSLQYRTDEYLRQEKAFSEHIVAWRTPKIVSSQGHALTYGPVERARGNTGDYSQVANKWGTFPIGEIFTEAIDLESVSGEALVEAYPGESFEVVHTEPFLIRIEKGRVLPSVDFPTGFQKTYDLILATEWEVMVRELGMGLNPAITTQTPLADINFYERKIGVHLSLGKKHGIYGKKLPKTMLQRYHIDVFLSLGEVYMGEELVFEKGGWVW